jgi:hypothetical protein
MRKAQDHDARNVGHSETGHAVEGGHAFDRLNDVAGVPLSGGSDHEEDSEA